MSEGMLVAIDIGGTKLAVGAARASEYAATGRIDRLRKIPVPGNGTPEAVLPVIYSMVEELTAENGIGAIGISIGGPLDHRSGIVINFPHLPEWKSIPLRDMVATHLNAPAALDNDANLGALAEYRWGAGKGCDPFIYLTISTGIGGGVIVGGKLVHGMATGGGEVGHITVQTAGPFCPCGNRGCLERMASGTNIARRARERVAQEPEAGRELLRLAGGDPIGITSENVLQAYRNGDGLGTDIWEEAAEYLAIGLGSLIHVLSPERIVLGGGVAQAGEDLLRPVKARLRDHVFYIPVDEIDLCTASLGHDSALLGAATLALDTFNGLDQR